MKSNLGYLYLKSHIIYPFDWRSYMTDDYKVFAGSIPEIHHTYSVQLIFKAYA